MTECTQLGIHLQKILQRCFSIRQFLARKRLASALIKLHFWLLSLPAKGRCRPKADSQCNGCVKGQPHDATPEPGFSFCHPGQHCTSNRLRWILKRSEQAQEGLQVRQLLNPMGVATLE